MGKCAISEMKRAHIEVKAVIGSGKGVSRNERAINPVSLTNCHLVVTCRD